MKISSKKDKPYGSWTGSGIATRDARNDKPVDEYPNKRGPGKPNKNWCKGQAGKEHKAEWKLFEEVDKGRYWWFGWSSKRPRNAERNWCALYCARCYKILEWDRSGQMAKKLRGKK